MASGSWLDLRSRIAALLVRPFSYDPTGRPVFTSMTQARVLRQTKRPSEEVR